MLKVIEEIRAVRSFAAAGAAAGNITPRSFQGKGLTDSKPHWRASLASFFLSSGLIPTTVLPVHVLFL